VIGRNVEIGPFTVIGPEVVIGDRTHIRSHAVIGPNVVMGQENEIWPGAVIGGDPQINVDLGRNCGCKIGSGSVFRECVTVNCGTEKGRGGTIVGDNSYLMSYAHVAHDCMVESNVTMSSGVLLGGHVAIERNVNIGGATAINQFTTIGRFAFLGGLTRIVHDVPPFVVVEGNPAEVRAVNRVGMRRGGIPEDVIGAVDRAYRLLYRSGKPFAEAFEELAAQRGKVPEVDLFIAAVERTAAGKKGRAQEADR
jgi:UDP-N-acetylglucosamine acyltransferase